MVSWLVQQLVVMRAVVMRVVVTSVGASLGLALLSGCANRPRVAEGGTAAPVRRDGPSGLGDATRIYQSMGLLASAGPIPFVGNVAYLAGPTPDTTLALFTFSLPNRALAFTRENDRYRAAYQVQLELRQGSTTVRRIDAQDTVRVAAFKETTRGDESIIFQQVMSLTPGGYALTFAVRDAGAARTATQEAAITVPRLAPGTLSTPIAFLEVTPRASTSALPRIVASPRSTAAFGRDTLVPMYLEGYGPGTQLPVAVAVRGERGGALWQDTISLERRGALFSGVINIPVARIGVGVTTLVAWRGDSSDSTRAPVFITFGDELPVASYEDMLNYLRYFTTPQRLQALRSAPPEQRAAAWGEFVRQTDPNPSTPQNERLRDYFIRLRMANDRFREEGGQGWLTDRGMTLVSLGEPDQIYEQGGPAAVNQRGRAQVWEYQTYRLQLVFIDQSGFGRWRLTSGSEADLQTVMRRLQTQPQ